MLSRFSVVAVSLLAGVTATADNWPQAAGPNADFKVDGDAPTKWSVVRNENIRWRTPLPECGQAAVTVWGDKVFTTIHQPIKSFDQRFRGGDIIGYCLDAITGEVLWTVELPGTQTMEIACGFSDATVFAPIADERHVWFFNRCGSMGCYTHDGDQVWLRKYKMRFRHSARMCEPMLLNGQILNVEVLDKEIGARITKFKPGTSITQKPVIPADVEDEKTIWTYLHGIDAATGKVLWRESVGTSVHNSPLIGNLADGTPAVVHARGGGHGPLEKPYGLSLTSLAKGNQGKTLWSTPLPGFDPPFNNHWNAKHVFAFHDEKHIVLDTNTGELLRSDPLYESATVFKRNASTDQWERQDNVAVKAGKKHANTNQANIVVGHWHWFLAHNMHYIGRVHTLSGLVEYLEVPAQLDVSAKSRDKDIWLWGKGKKNQPTNAAGFAIGRKGHNTTGWGHISAASPILVGKYLYCPVVTGTVYVLDTTVDELSPRALVAVNDLGPSGETWTLASFSYADQKLYMHTMREVICIGTSR